MFLFLNSMFSDIYEKNFISLTKHFYITRNTFYEGATKFQFIEKLVYCLDFRKVKVLSCYKKK